MTLCLVGVLVGLAAVGPLPDSALQAVPGGIKPDGYDHVYGAVGLLQGRYEVSWDGGLVRPPP